MPRIRRSFAFLAMVLACLSIFIFAAPQASAQIDSSLFSGMRWRLVGPYRAGRVTAVAGIPGNPAVYYMGTPGGGVWKTTDGGVVWKPIFDAAHVASIGALAVAPSDPNIIYVGTGEQTQGDGVWKSTDAGATWTHIGLEDTHYINSVIVDPKNPNIVLVGAMGDGTPGPARGVFKSTDGGRSWSKVLFRDSQTGIADMCTDPMNPKVVYAALWRPAFRIFVASNVKEATGPDAWIYKSSDEGTTWKPLEGKGLPTEKWGRTGVAVAPGDHGRRVFAIVSQGLYRSDDAGATWRQITKDPRVVGNGYFSRVFVDPRNPDVVYVVQTCLYRSADGGVTFEAFKGAPDGDDYHVLWIDPTNRNWLFLGVDQGATISVDGGKTWSLWYNQPTGQFYHVSADNHFPYDIYASQQDSGSAAMPSRSDFGRIRDRDVFSPDGYEFGYIVGDPVHHNFVFSGGEAGSIVRLDRTTNQMVSVLFHSSKYRASGNAPIQFSPKDPHTLYYGAQMVLDSTDSGMSWQEMSPDLTVRPQAKNEPPARFQDNVITTLSPSPISASVMWVGTSDGLIQLTRDGGATWQNVSPPDLGDRSLVSIIEASHFDPGTAYAAVDFFLATKPYFYRTTDYGHTWQKITNGLPDLGIARVVREDTVRKGLLFAGTETGVFVSFDDGDHWQSLQLNLPTASMRDLAVSDNDLVVATYGRALWILDDLTPLRQANSEVANSDAYFYNPETAYRMRWDNDQDTPLPPEVPAGQNPPDGAMLDYYLKSAPQGDISMAIYDSQGNLVRQYSSAQPPPMQLKPDDVPEYWFSPPVDMPKQAGMNRFVWDLRYPHPMNLSYSLLSGLDGSVSFYDTEDAVPGVTPRFQPLGRLVVPGEYQIVLSVNGQTYRRTLHVVEDPRVRASQFDLVEQSDLLKQVSTGMAATYDAYGQVAALRAALADRQKSLAANPQAKDAAAAAAEFEKKLTAVGMGNFRAPGIAALNGDFTQAHYAADTGDGRPSETERAAVGELCQELSKTFDAWRQLNAQDLPALSLQLAKYNLAALPATPAIPANAGCGQ